jgi:hypothetical protein
VEDSRQTLEDTVGNSVELMDKKLVLFMDNLVVEDRLAVEDFVDKAVVKDDVDTSVVWD